MVSAGGTISTIVGNGSSGSPVDWQPATQTPFSQAGGLAVDASGNLYVSSLSNLTLNASNLYAFPITYGEIYAVTGGKIHRIGGGGTVPAADGMDARNASNIVGYGGILVDSNGDLYASNAFQIWKLILNSPTGLTITGGNNQTGTAGSALPTALAVLVNGRAGVGVAGAITLTVAVPVASVCTLNSLRP